MTQVPKGGKFILGVSVIQPDGSVCFPLPAVMEYEIASEGKVYLFTGNKITGGFCVSRKGLLLLAKSSIILENLPELADYTLPKGEFVEYKGKSYCWTDIREDGTVRLSCDMMDVLEVYPGKGLLSIRSSSTAFTMCARGPLFDQIEETGSAAALTTAES